MRDGSWDSTPAAAQALNRVTAYCGAFPLKPGSKDKAEVVRLFPGAYTIVLETFDGSEGEALVEVYLLR